MTILVITGTSTGVGKTIATAALASQARQSGRDIAVVKPVQTGTVDGDDDLAEIGRLAGITHLSGLARYPQPLGPVAAAEQAGMDLPDRSALLDAIRAADAPDRLTLVEGAGGLLVELGADGVTLRDLAADLDAAVLVVVSAELGTLNHTALTVEALEHQGVRCAGLVIGSWPDDPGAAAVSNRTALTQLAPVRAVLPAGAGALAPADFAALTFEVFDPEWLQGLR